MDSSTVISEALSSSARKLQPLVVLAYRPGRAPETDRLGVLLAEAAKSVHLEWRTRPPTSLKDPKSQRILDEAAWIPIIRQFRGTVTIDSLAFASPSSARVRYLLTEYQEPRPSREATRIGWLTLRREPAGRWAIASDELETIADGDYYLFADPRLVSDTLRKRWMTETRAMLTARGMKIP